MNCRRVETPKAFFQRLFNVVVYARHGCVLPCLLWFACVAGATEPRLPKTILWYPEHLRLVRSESVATSSQTKEILKQLRTNADEALERGPYSVMDKSVVPPSGDKHDYMSFSRYWWPNPDTSDGLPYIRRDGHMNRKSVALGDRDSIGYMYDDVETLSLAYFFFGDEEYAEHAAVLLRTWFLDPQTRMNPHLRYGQAVPGLSEGKQLRDHRHAPLHSHLRCRGPPGRMPCVDSTDRESLTAWFTEYLHWLRNSPLGIGESQSENNHGTWYDAQTARIALFVGQPRLAEEIVRRSRNERLEKQIAADGRQPEELARTQSMHYSLFNLSAICVLARVGDAVDVNLWNYPSSNDAALRRALDYLLPYMKKDKPWPYKRIAPFSISPEEIYVLYLASNQYGDSQYIDTLAKLNKIDPERNYVPLLIPLRRPQASDR